MYCYLMICYFKGHFRYKDNNDMKRLLNDKYVQLNIIDYYEWFPINDGYIYITNDGREFFENFNLKIGLPLIISITSLLISIAALVVSIVL